MRRFPGHPSTCVGNRLARRTPSARSGVWFGADSNAYVYAQRRSVWRRLYPMPVEGEPVYAHCGVDSGPGSGPALDDQARALRRAVAGSVRWGGGGHFVNKRIANNRRIELLDRAFPAARFIDLTRDGRAVALSLSRVDWWEGSVVWWYGGTPKAWRDAGGDPWELCARNWVEEVRAIDAGLRGIAPERVLRLRYEEFVAAPLDTLRCIARFMGLDESPGWSRALEGLRFPNRNEAWRRQLAPDTVHLLEAVQGEELRARGYL